MAESYHEIVAESPLALLKGLVAGLLIARGLEPREILFAEEHGVECESLAEQISEWMHLHQNVSHLLVPHPLHADLKADLDRAAALLGIKLRSDRLVESASFDFSYVAYNAKQARELDELFTGRADRIRLSEDYRPVTTTDPDAAGIELYAPAHAFEVAASGTATGDLAAVLDLYRLARSQPLLKLKKIRLHRMDD